MAQKKLEKGSTYNDLDLDGDGVVSMQNLLPLKRCLSMRKQTPSAEWPGSLWGL